MATHQDHDRQDAHHAIRIELSGRMGQYMRRLREEAYAIVNKEAAEYDGDEPIDWFARGRMAANEALANWGIGYPSASLDPAPPAAAIDAPADPDDD